MLTQSPFNGYERLKKTSALHSYFIQAIYRQKLNAALSVEKLRTLFAVKKKLFSDKNNPLMPPLMVMTLSIITLVLLSQFLIKQSLNNIKSDAAVKNMVGEQRMLSQQMVKEIAADNIAGVIVGKPVAELVKDFSYKHKALLIGDSRLNMKPLDENFLRDYNNMDAAYKSFMRSLEQTIASENNNDYFIDLMDKQEAFLKQMDTFAYVVDGYSDTKARKFQLNEILITLGSLVIILLEVLFIFLPAISKIKKQNEQLKTIAYTQSHIVRQPVANLKGLLFLMNDAQLDNEAKQLVELATSEAEKIDTIIKKTVYATQD